MKNIFKNAVNRKKFDKAMLAVSWAAAFAMLLPLCDNKSAASQRAQKLISGENCYFVTSYIRDASLEWKSIEILEKIKDNLKK